MNKIVLILFLIIVFYGGLGMSQPTHDTIEIYDASTNTYNQTQKEVKTAEQWKKILTHVRHQLLP